jgi:hypothetical protein
MMSMAASVRGKRSAGSESMYSWSIRMISSGGTSSPVGETSPSLLERVGSTMQAHEIAEVAGDASPLGSPASR